MDSMSAVIQLEYVTFGPACNPTSSAEQINDKYGTHFSRYHKISLITKQL